MPQTVGEWVPYAVAAPGLAWWMANVWLTMAGVFTDHRIGYQSWVGALSRRPQWMQSLLAYTATPAVVAALLVAGGIITLRGRKGLVPVLGIFLAATVASAFLATFNLWLHPGG